MSRASGEIRNNERMTIGVLARESGVAVRTLRFYEEQGLITPLGRTAKGYRLYGPAALEGLAFLKGAKRLGLHLDDIRELLRLRTQGQCPCGRTREFVRTRLEGVEGAIGELRALQDQMRRTLRAWDSESPGAARSPCHTVHPEFPDGA